MVSATSTRMPLMPESRSEHGTFLSSSYERRNSLDPLHLGTIGDRAELDGNRGLLCATPLKGYSRACREGIVEPLVAPEHLEVAADGAIVMRNHDLGTIWILESHIGKATQSIGGEMVRARHDKLAELAELIVIVAIGHIARRLVDGHHAQAVGAAASVRTIVGIERNIPQFDRPGHVLHRLHQQIDRGDRSFGRAS